MPRAREQLTAGEWAVLALLVEEPTHGFAIARAMEPEGEVGKVWTMRRPLVYRAVDTLTAMDLVRPGRTVPSRVGPARTVLEPTPAGRRAVTRWLRTPVDHVRDARSELMLKLLFLTRRDADSEPLLAAQREQFGALAHRLAGAAEEARGFDRTLLLWRFENASAAVRFVETLLGERRAGQPTGVKRMA